MDIKYNSMTEQDIENIIRRVTDGEKIEYKDLIEKIEYKKLRNKLIKEIKANSYYSIRELAEILKINRNIIQRIK